MKAILVGVRLALIAIQRNVLRAALTVLGILIAVAAVVAITSLGTGARDSMAEQDRFARLEHLRRVPAEHRRLRRSRQAGEREHLSDEDARAIEREATSVKAVAPFLGLQGQVVYGVRNWSTDLNGTTQAILEVANWHVERGEMWTEHDEATKAKVSRHRSDGGGPLRDLDPVGETIRIGRYPYKVVGVFKAKGQGPFGNDQDDLAMMPIGSMRARILKSPPGSPGSSSSPPTRRRRATGPSSRCEASSASGT